MAAGLSLEVARWLGLFDELMGRIAGRFGRVEPRRRARAKVRTWTSWHCWVTLAMLALAFLTITAAEHTRPPPPAQIPLTRNEIARLFTALTGQPARDPGHLLRWSQWRRRHQHRAKTSHYQRQARQP